MIQTLAATLHFAALQAPDGRQIGKFAITDKATTFDKAMHKASASTLHFSPQIPRKDSLYVQC